MGNLNNQVSPTNKGKISSSEFPRPFQSLWLVICRSGIIKNILYFWVGEEGCSCTLLWISIKIFLL